MKLNKKKKNINKEPTEIISNYLYDIDEIKNKMIKNNLIRYDSFEEPINYDEDIVKWMC
jgi:hypothetical protein